VAFHSVEERRRITEVHTGSNTAALPRYGKANPLAVAWSRPFEDQAQPLFDKGGQRLAPLVRLAFGIPQQAFV
jgi:hypothetical protein